MNFCVAPRKIREISKRGGQNKLQGVSKNHEKIERPPVYFEPESMLCNSDYKSNIVTVNEHLVKMNSQLPTYIFIAMSELVMK